MAVVALISCSNGALAVRSCSSSSCPSSLVQSSFLCTSSAFSSCAGAGGGGGSPLGCFTKSGSVIVVKKKKKKDARRMRVPAVVSSSSFAAADSGKPSSSSSREMDEEFLEVAHKLADAAGAIVRQHFRMCFDILHKADTSPVTIADRAAEEAMRTILAQRFPTHAIYGEEGGLKMLEGGAKYTWVLDPIDGTKSFITGKPVFGTLIALVRDGVPVLGVIDQPVLRERWIGRQGHATTLNGNNIHSRSSCTILKDAYLYTTSPHLFSKSAEEAFVRVRDQVKMPLYGCDCYAYGLLAAGFVDLVVESGLKPYDFLALVPVVEGAGGVITDWQGRSLRWFPDTDPPAAGSRGFEVVAAGSASLHEAAVTALAWR